MCSFVLPSSLSDIMFIADIRTGRTMLLSSFEAELASLLLGEIGFFTVPKAVLVGRFAIVAEVFFDFPFDRRTGRFSADFRFVSGFILDLNDLYQQQLQQKRFIFQN